MGTIDPVGSANALAANDALRLLALLQLAQRSTAVLRPHRPSRGRRGASRASARSTSSSEQSRQGTALGSVLAQEPGFVRVGAGLGVLLPPDVQVDALRSAASTSNQYVYRTPMSRGSMARTVSECWRHWRRGPASRCAGCFWSSWRQYAFGLVWLNIIPSAGAWMSPAPYDPAWSTSSTRRARHAYPHRRGPGRADRAADRRAAGRLRPGAAGSDRQPAATTAGLAAMQKPRSCARRRQRSGAPAPCRSRRRRGRPVGDQARGQGALRRRLAVRRSRSSRSATRCSCAGARSGVRWTRAGRWLSCSATTGSTSAPVPRPRSCARADRVRVGRRPGRLLPRRGRPQAEVHQGRRADRARRAGGPPERSQGHPRRRGHRQAVPAAPARPPTART